MLRIIVDGSADMPDGWPGIYQFDILPMPIQIGNTTYYQGEDITPELFYELVLDQGERPKTAAPSPDRIADFIQRVCDLGDTVLSINVSGEMSATVAMIKQAAIKLQNEINVNVFDSKAGSAVLALMAREARLREKAGASLDEILEVLKQIRETVMVVLTLDSLDFAYRSGRVGALKAGLTSILKIKPIVTLKKGMLNVSDMVRTRKKSLERIVETVNEQFKTEPIKIVIVHSQDRETAEILREMCENALNITETIFTELSISVAANLGPKTVGIVALPETI
jgi:DegV family protein with EDD domain